MRVLVVFRSRVLKDSGTPLRARNLVKALAQQPGVEVVLLSQDETTEIQNTLSLTHKQLQSHSSHLAQLHSCITDFRPAVVYGQTHKAMELMAKVRDLPQKPLFVADLHGDLASERLERADKPPIWRWYWYGRTRFREKDDMLYMDAFTAVSHNLLQSPHRLKKPGLILWGGVELDKFHPVLPSATNGRIHVAYAGNYRPYQGVSVLLQAANRLVAAGEPFHFTFIGDIEPYPDQVALAHKLGDHVTLPGLIPFADIPAWLGQADVLVTPRADGHSARYNYPSKLSEQLAMGKAIIVTNVGEAGQLAQHEKTGLVIHPDSVDDMVEALLRLKDNSLRQQLGQEARIFAEKNLAWPILAGKLAVFFEELNPVAHPI
ncbi:MAG: glycosyltransferase family 4 protein [Anaerolineae bacterium]|nr:glycosyltransferase family 4 protein [Anaerolineae bacterium]